MEENEFQVGVRWLAEKLLEIAVTNGHEGEVNCDEIRYIARAVGVVIEDDPEC